MRRLGSVLTLAVSLTFGACGDDETTTVTRTPPTQTVTVAAMPTTPATTPPGSARFREPSAGERTQTVEGTAANGETRRVSDVPSDASVYGYFELTPNDGGAALRIGVASDLDLDPEGRRALLSSRCSGKVRGTFEVDPAPPPETKFDWILLGAKLRQSRCGP